MSEYALALVLGIASSLAASVVWLYCFSRLRPKMDISPYIAFKTTETGEKRYVLKLRNRTKRPVINVRCRLSVIVPKSVPGGRVYNNRRLALRVDEVFCIDKYDPKDPRADYAWRLVCYEDIEADWDEEHGGCVVLRVLATDSLSGLSTYTCQRFFSKRECLKEGSHRFGDCLEVE